MFNYNKLKIVIFTFLLLSIVFHSFSQNSVIKNKRSIGLTAKLPFFDKANIYKKYGNIKYEPQYSYSYIFGFTFDINLKQEKTSSIKPGIYFGTIPVINGKFHLDKDDVDYYGENYSFNGLQMTSFLIIYVPIKYEYRINLYKNVINFSVGPQFIHTPEFSVEEGVVIGDKEVYASYIETDSKIFVDIQSSIGLYFNVGKLVFNTELEYNLSLKEKFKGEYQFGNLNVSEPTRGDMSVNGNYLALSLTVYLTK